MDSIAWMLALTVWMGSGTAGLPQPSAFEEMAQIVQTQKQEAPKKVEAKKESPKKETVKKKSPKRTKASCNSEFKVWDNGRCRNKTSGEIQYEWVEQQEKEKKKLRKQSKKWDKSNGYKTNELPSVDEELGDLVWDQP